MARKIKKTSKYHGRSVWTLGAKAIRMTASVRKKYLSFSKPNLLAICQRGEMCRESPIY